MDNQSSGPQIIFPNVPDDFCPTGNWTQVFQEFIDDVLANGTINVPGLGDVTPAEIQNINTELTNLQNEVDALGGITVLTGTATGFVSNSDSTVAVTFTNPLPNILYTISLTPVIPAVGIGAAAPIIGILESSKSVGGFTISLQNNGTTPNFISSVDWGVVHQA